MNLDNTASVEQLQVISRFEGLRRILSSEEYSEHLEKPLAYWALPTDRRLPLAFLGRSLKDLLDTPFAELSKTPGIGQKKICSFVNLLARAANTNPADLPMELVMTPPHDPSAKAKSNGHGHGSDDLFDPANVSEVLWNKWRASILKHGLQNETLGCFAPTLKDMTRVIWKKPLGEYTGMALGEIRSMRTHGEKRVRAILDVFHAVHAMVADMGTQPHLMVRIVPRSIDRVERWIGKALQTLGIPSEKEIFEEFVEPLLEQVRNDATQQIASLAENRLGITGPITSVRQAARTMGLTRARVYQLLNEINDILIVRWPDGRHQVYELREKFQTEAASMEDAPDLKQFLAAIELFYPGCRRGAAGPLDQAEPSATSDELAEFDDASVEARTTV